MWEHLLFLGFVTVLGFILLKEVISRDYIWMWSIIGLLELSLIALAVSRMFGV